jgi:hypothetical protein
MAITAAQLKIIIRGSFGGTLFENVQWYRPTGAAFLTADAVGVAEAYWNDIKTVWRALQVTSGGFLTQSVFVSEPGATGAFGEFSIPVGEQQGARSATGLGDFMPAFVAFGVRLSVATRTTRPGQKRFIGVMEGDATQEVLGAPVTTLLNNLAAKFSSTITLGAPVATGTLDPIIVRIDRATGALLTQQDVTGHLVNPRVTSQVSRKFGRGA